MIDKLMITAHPDDEALFGGAEIKSIENRVLLFDPSTEHHSTTCTDQKVRININFNYF
jgi:LmbE family N-acetylglucosaminyl deacetylase